MSLLNEVHIFLGEYLFFFFLANFERVVLHQPRKFKINFIKIVQKLITNKKLRQF